MEIQSNSKFSRFSSFLSFSLLFIYFLGFQTPLEDDNSRDGWLNPPSPPSPSLKMTATGLGF